MTSFGTRATESLFALFDRAKLSGEPRATSRAVLAPKMAALLDEALAAHLAEKSPKTKGKRPVNPTAAEIDEVWLCELEQLRAYDGIDVRRELGKAQAWAGANGRRISRKRFVNWLNRVERPVAVNGAGKSSFAGPQRGNPYAEPMDWRVRIVSLPYDAERLKELSAGKWLDVPITIRQEMVQ